MISNGVKEKKILINSLKVNYKIAGEGEPLLILHGWGGSSDSWLLVQKILAKLNFKVICPDLPGFGKTAPPAEPWGVKDYNDFLLNLIEKLEINNFFLLGHSFGGQISVRFASRYPERIKKLILCAPSAIRPKPGKKTRMIYLMARIGNTIFSPRHLRRLKDAARNLFYIFIRNRDYKRAEGVMRDTIRKVIKEDLLPELSKIQNKTLIVWGDIDKMVPVKYASIFRDNIPESRLEIFPKIGHSPHLEVPEKLAEIINNFFRS